MAAVLLGGNELARRTQEFRGYEAVGARATCSLEPIQPIAHDFWFHHPKEGTAIVPGFNRDDSLGFEQVIVGTDVRGRPNNPAFVQPTHEYGRM